MSEHRLQMAVAAFLSAVLPRDAAWTAVDAGQGRMDMKAAQIRKARGVHAGWPDIQVVWRGYFHGIELKAEKGRVSDRQEHVHVDLKNAGAFVSVCRSIADVERALIHWAIPLRGTTLTAAERDERLASPKPTRATKPRARPTAAQIKRIAGMRGRIAF